MTDRPHDRLRPGPLGLGGSWDMPGASPSGPLVLVFASTVGGGEQAARDLAIPAGESMVVTSSATLRRARTTRRPLGAYVVADDEVRRARWWADARDLVFAAGLVERPAP